MKYAWIEKQRRSFPLPVLCGALSVSQCGFRAWQAGGRPDRKRLTDAQALVLIRTIHQEVRQAYGARRIHAELRGRGYRIGLPRIERLMRENGIRARHKRRYKATTNSRHSLPVAANVLDRDFAPDRGAGAARRLLQGHGPAVGAGVGLQLSAPRQGRLHVWDRRVLVQWCVLNEKWPLRGAKASSRLEFARRD
ncbi:IS3 family transposase [Aromatoleum evansii]|nr:IS3 family transposase [Aromatoleum evansii]